MAADRNTWKNLPAPTERETFTVDWTFDREMAERMAEGHKPQDMSDRWFIMMEDGWLLFHRSWTGSCIFGLKVEIDDNGATCSDGWASRDTEEYRGEDIAKDKALIYDLLMTYFRFAPREYLAPVMPAPIK